MTCIILIFSSVNHSNVLHVIKGKGELFSQMLAGTKCLFFLKKFPHKRCLEWLFKKRKKTFDFKKAKTFSKGENNISD